MSSYGSNLEMGAPPGAQRPPSHPQALQKQNAYLDKDWLQESSDKGGVGYITGDASKDAWIVHDGQIAIERVRPSQGGTGRKRNMVGMQQVDSSSIPIRTNLAGIGEPGMSKAAFMQLFTVPGIVIREAETPEQRRGQADRIGLVVVRNGGLYVTNWLNKQLPAGKPMFWDVADPSRAALGGREIAKDGYPSGAPYLFLREFKPEEHLFSRELVNQMRINADMGKTLQDPTYDEAYERLVTLSSGMGILIASVIIGSYDATTGAFRDRTPAQAYAMFAGSNNAANVALRQALTVMLSKSDKQNPLHKLIRATLAPKNSTELVLPTNALGNQPVPNPILGDGKAKRKYASIVDVQKNTWPMLCLTFRRWETYVTDRIMGVLPHGAMPGEHRATFFVDVQG